MDQAKISLYSSSNSTTAALCVVVSPGQICSSPHSKGCSLPLLPNCSAPFSSVVGPAAAASSSGASVGGFTPPLSATEYRPSMSACPSPLSLLPSLSGSGPLAPLSGFFGRPSWVRPLLSPPQL